MRTPAPRFIRPGKLVENAFIESFNGKPRARIFQEPCNML